MNTTTARDLTPGQTVLLNGPETVTELDARTDRRRGLVRIMTDKRPVLGLLISADALIDVIA